ncbi:probable disease resistance protein At1g58602 [Gossypium arboreum]|uniref:probable disease resistance protein At1g58602 n=1 Tax=Gossypium arboreum TaxID=29729 RepID=UPI0022F18E4F|nr:probable disease resistance protein At1g58602 [Gossypium arboreum]
MDFSAISSVVQTVGRLLTQEVTSLMGVKDQVEDLQKELEWIQNFKEATRGKLMMRSKGGFSNVTKRFACILNEGGLLCQTKCEIQKITARITQLTRRLQTYDVKQPRDGAGSSSSNQRRELRRPYHHIVDNNVVGLHDDIKKLVSILVDEESDCNVVSICGMGGLENIVDSKLEELGKDMVNNCRGLPLAIIVLGGILATKSSIHEWKIVHKNAKSYLKKGKGAQHIEHVLALSYDDLPPYLRSCFLYLSQFPEDYQIPAERLIQLWVAEGIVSSIEEEGNGEIMEDVAEGFLDELVERCMVQVGERDPTLKVKTCHIHDLMRDLCLSIAKQENFFSIINHSSVSPSNTRAVHRIVVHQHIHVQRIKSSIPLRSILFFWHPFDLDLELCLSVEDDFWWFVWFVCLILKWQRSWNYMFGNFKKLRVLSFEGGVKGYSGFKLSSAIGNLIHLRCLNLCGIVFYCPNIATSLGNLRCLQTLDLRIFRHADYGAMNVPNIIWKLEQLRHLYLPLTMTYKTKLKLHTLTNMLTLINFNTRNCLVADLSKFTKLRKLGILGPFHIDDFKEKMDKNLPIIANGEVARFSPFLFEYRIVEDPMPTLEKLPNLRVLELYVYAFIGKEIVCSALHFPKLESLTFSELWNLEEWKVEEGAVPALRYLKISGCKKLKMLSVGLRFITTLQELKIEYIPKAFKGKMEKLLSRVVSCSIRCINKVKGGTAIGLC